MYSTLPQRFKEIRQITFNPEEDRYSFQAANIAAAMQLVRMSLFTSESASTNERCQIVRELVQAFADVPVAHLRAISVPLLHHLAGIGTILSSVVHGPLSDPTYNQIRAVLLALVDLLTKLEEGTVCGAGACQRLRQHIQRMDRHMELQMQQFNAGHHSRRIIEEKTPPSAGRADLDPADCNLALGDLSEPAQEFYLPAELTDDWSWAFDFAQVTA